jgi:DNA-binding transcriptional LysR family regulator
MIPQVGHDITLDQLEVLLAIVEHGSFTAAARALGRTQGGVSYHVQRLEEQLELQLFDRTGRRPVLTEEGAVVARQAQRLRDDLRRLRAVAAGLHQGLEPQLRLAFDALFPPAPLARLLTAFRARFPSVDVEIETGIATIPARQVRDGDAMLGVAQARAAPDLEQRASVTIEFVLVVAPDHPLAELDRPITIDDLRQHPNLVLPTRPDEASLVRSTASRLRRWRVGDSYLRHELVRRGAGWARLPRHQVEADLATGRLVCPDVSTIPEAVVRLPLAVVTHPDRPPGPAGRWWVERLATSSAGADRDPPS